MKKKLENLALEIAGSPINDKGQRDKLERYEISGKHVVFDRYRILQTEERIPGLRLETDETIKRMLSSFMDKLYGDLDYYAMEIPSVEEIKEGIRECCGRKLDAVAFCHNGLYPALNARSLWKALYALNATKIFIASTQDYKRRPVYILENDDPQTENIFMLLPIYNNDGRVGFWTNKR